MAIKKNQDTVCSIFKRGVILLLGRPIISWGKNNASLIECFSSYGWWSSIWHQIKSWKYLLENIHCFLVHTHYSDVTMGAMASQITSLTNVYQAVHSGADQRKHQSSASLAFVRGIHRWPVNSPHKWPVTRKMFPFEDVIMMSQSPSLNRNSWEKISVGEINLLCSG